MAERSTDPPPLTDTLLWPGGVLCISDLDTEPGVFHDPEAAATVRHHGFDRQEFRSLMERAGFHDVRDTTGHTIRKPLKNRCEAQDGMRIDTIIVRMRLRTSDSFR